MFVQTSDSSLIFIQSKYVKAFPCSRRRSTPIDGDDDAGTVHDRYYIPFDPEARLNTEANNRKHSGLNGYKQTYLYEWDSVNGKLSIVLAGYLFEIQLSDSYITPVLFGQKLEELLTGSNKVFVNIRLDAVEFFAGASGVPAATTEILRNQTATVAPSSSLDMLADNSSADKIDSYYFSGLTLTSAASTSKNVISMCLLEKADDGWKIHEQSRLPAIDHGSTENSVRVGTLEADEITVVGKNKLTSLQVVETSSSVYQLQFSTI